MEQHANEPTPQAVGSFRLEMPVRWGDLDALNHVNNTVYFRYMEEARVQCFKSALIGEPGSDRDFVLAHTSCDFLRPVLWPATVRVDMRLLRLGRSSLESEAEIHVVGDDGGPCARARNVIVGVSMQTGRPSPWTPAEVERLNRAFGVREA